MIMPLYPPHQVTPIQWMLYQIVLWTGISSGLLG